MLLIFSISLILAYTAYLSSSPLYICCISIAFSISIISFTYKKLAIKGLTPIIIFCIVSIINTYANILTLNSLGTSEESNFNVYLVKDHLPTAAFISFLGLWSISLGFTFTDQNNNLKNLLPKLDTTVDLNGKINFLLYLAYFLILLIYLGLFPNIKGGVGAVIKILPTGLIFIITRYSFQKNLPKIKNGVLILALLESIRALLFEYIRNFVVIPLAAYLLGSIFGTNSFKPLKHISIIPIIGILVFFSMYFGVLGKTRSYLSTGFNRIPELIKYKAEEERDKEIRRGKGILTRGSSLNQLTQVVRVSIEDGFYYGKTLDYLAYVFIPRFVWPDKPIIAQGGWFAARIGFAYKIQNAGYTNSIDMTIPGELYLNFDLEGVIIGGFLVGIIIGMFWNSTNFWSNKDNIVGLMFGFYLLQVGSSMGADLQILITLISLYLLFYLLNKFLKTHTS